MSLEKMFQAIENLRDTASANVVFGEPRQVGERLIIPVARVGVGFGMGFGQGIAEEAPAEGAPLEEQVPEQEAAERVPLPEEPEPAARGVGGGGGGSARARPVAIIEVTPEETVIKPIVDEGRVALAGILLVGWLAFWLMLTLRAILGRQG